MQTAGQTQDKEMTPYCFPITLFLPALPSWGDIQHEDFSRKKKSCKYTLSVVRVPRVLTQGLSDDNPTEVTH